MVEDVQARCEVVCSGPSRKISSALRSNPFSPLPQACVLAHSYGCFVAACLARRHASRLHSLCLLDPVCFGVFLPKLLSNFIYR
jgi:pimeloyl-ACP methyl ester carboxylesterase